MEHYLITRFNLKNEDWYDSNSTYHVLSKTWLDERFSVFQNYCLPSVDNQTNKFFKWLVCFDIDTPNFYINKIKDLQSKFPYLQPLYINGFKELEKDVTNFIKNDSKKEFIITTRLDNDDIIHEDFIKTIQKLYKPINAVINLDLGYQLVLLNNKKAEIRLVKKDFNPFMSAICKREHFTSVLSKNHRDWKTHKNQITYSKNRLWIQFIHGNNILNEVTKASKKTVDFDEKSFGLKEIDFNDSRLKVNLFNFFLIPFRWYFKLKLIIKKSLKESF